MAGSTATRTRRNVNFWPPGNRPTTKTPGSGRKPSRSEAGKRNHFATSCKGPLLRPSRPVGGGTAGQGPGMLPAGHCPGAGNVRGRRQEIPFGRKPSCQETQRQGASQGRGSGRIAIGRQLSRGDIFPFQLGGRNRWTTTQRQISVSRETPALPVGKGGFTLSASSQPAVGNRSDSGRLAGRSASLTAIHSAAGQPQS